MNSAALLSLQHIDSQLDALANRRPRLPERAAHSAAAAKCDELRVRIREVESRVASAQAAIDAAEHSAEALTTKRARLEVQLKTVIAPREAEALMSEIATLNAKRSELDDAELAALDEQSAGELHLAELLDELPEYEAAVAATKSALDTVVAELDGEQARLVAERVPAASLLSADELAAYDHARHRFGGVAIARLEGHRCTGCHLDLSAGEVDTIKATAAGSLPECPQCGRFLVR